MWPATWIEEGIQVQTPNELQVEVIMQGEPAQTK